MMQLSEMLGSYVEPTEVKSESVQQPKTEASEMENLVNEFASQHGLDVEVVRNFVETVLQNQRPNGGGRKASNETLEARRMVKEWALDHKGEKFTIKQLEEVLGIDRAILNNTVRYFADLFEQVGYAEKAEKSRGRREVVWQVK